MNEGQDVYAELKEITRRLENLETAARVPQVSVRGSAGLQFDVQPPYDFAASLSGASAEFLAEPNLLPELFVNPTTSRNIFVLYGGELSTSANVGALGVTVTAPDGSDLPDEVPLAGWGFDSISTSESGWVTRGVLGFPGFTLPRIRLKMTLWKSTGSFTYGVTSAWMMAFPL